MKAAAIVLAFVASTAHAEYFSGNKLHEWAGEPNSNVSFGMLYGYVAGAYDAGFGVMHCAPANVTLGQVVDMVKQHIAANPASRHASGDAIVNYVVKQAWPCPKRESKQGGNV